MIGCCLARVITDSSVTYPLTGSSSRVKLAEDDIVTIVLDHSTSMLEYSSWWYVVLAHGTLCEIHKTSVIPLDREGLIDT